MKTLKALIVTSLLALGLFAATGVAALGGQVGVDRVTMIAPADLEGLTSIAVRCTNGAVGFGTLFNPTQRQVDALAEAFCDSYN